MSRAWWSPTTSRWCGRPPHAFTSCIWGGSWKRAAPPIYMSGQAIPIRALCLPRFRPPIPVSSGTDPPRRFSETFPARRVRLRDAVFARAVQSRCPHAPSQYLQWLQSHKATLRPVSGLIRMREASRTARVQPQIYPAVTGMNPRRRSASALPLT